jgi:ATP-dependent Lon protease
MQFDQTLAELVLPPAPDTPEFVGDVDDSDVARKPAGSKWKYHWAKRHFVKQTDF